MGSGETRVISEEAWPSENILQVTIKKKCAQIRKCIASVHNS